MHYTSEIVSQKLFQVIAAGPQTLVFVCKVGNLIGLFGTPSQILSSLKQGFPCIGPRVLVLGLRFLGGIR